MEVLCAQDLVRIDAERARDIRITLVEGLQLLGSFDVRLREYAARKLHKQGVHLVKVCRPPPPPIQIPRPDFMQASLLWGACRPV